MKTCISDSVLAAHVRGVLHQNGRLCDKDINITVDEGWVSLDGKVEQESDRHLVQSCVENILGVFGVTNNLTFSRLRFKTPAATK